MCVCVCGVLPTNPVPAVLICGMVHIRIWPGEAVFSLSQPMFPWSQKSVPVKYSGVCVCVCGVFHRTCEPHY